MGPLVENDEPTFVHGTDTSEWANWLTVSVHAGRAGIGSGAALSSTQAVSSPIGRDDDFELGARAGSSVWARQLAPMHEASDIARRLYGGCRSVGKNVDVAIRYRSSESRGIHPNFIPTTQRNGPD